MGGNMKTEIINIRVVSFWPRAICLRSFFHPKIRVSYHKCCRIMTKISVEASNWRFCTEPEKWKKMSNRDWCKKIRLTQYFAITKKFTIFCRFLWDLNRLTSSWVGYFAWVSTGLDENGGFFTNGLILS